MFSTYEFQYFDPNVMLGPYDKNTHPCQSKRILAEDPYTAEIEFESWHRETFNEIFKGAPIIDEVDKIYDGDDYEYCLKTGEEYDKSSYVLYEKPCHDVCFFDQLVISMAIMSNPTDTDREKLFKMIHIRNKVARGDDTLDDTEKWFVMQCTYEYILKEV